MLRWMEGACGVFRASCKKEVTGAEARLDTQEEKLYHLAKFNLFSHHCASGKTFVHFLYTTCNSSLSLFLYLANLFSTLPIFPFFYLTDSDNLSEIPELYILRTHIHIDTCTHINTHTYMHIVFVAADKGTHQQGRGNRSRQK